MKIQAIGGCCRKSQQNYENAVKAVQAAGLSVTVEHVIDPVAIANLGVLASPAIVIDGKVMASGRLSSVAQILEMIEKRKPLAAAEKRQCCESTCECEQDKCECGDEKCECKDGKCECKDGKCECGDDKCECRDDKCECHDDHDCCGHEKK